MKAGASPPDHRRDGQLDTVLRKVRVFAHVQRLLNLRDQCLEMRHLRILVAPLLPEPLEHSEAVD